MFPRFKRLKTPKRRLNVPAPATARWPDLIGAPMGALTILQRKRIACVSSGSVASRIAVHFARMQIASLVIVDPAAFKPQSVLTHDIGPAVIGRPKAQYVAEYCRQISRETVVTAHVGRVQDLPPSALADCDLVVLASDNLNAETFTGQLCLHLGIPLLNAAVHGETLTAQIRFFAGAGQTSACPGCLFNDHEWKLHDDEAIFSCNGGEPTLQVQPTISTSFLCSIAADLAVTQAVRHFLGLGDPVANTLLTWSGYTHRSLVSPLAKSESCRLEHVTWQRAAAPKPLVDCTIEELLAAAEMRISGQATIAIEGYAWAEKAFCCGGFQQIDEFVAQSATAAVACPKCRKPLAVPPFFLRRETPLASLRTQVPLTALGIAATGGVVLSDGTRGVLVRHAAHGNEPTTDIVQPPIASPEGYV